MICALTYVCSFARRERKLATARGRRYSFVRTPRLLAAITLLLGLAFSGARAAEPSDEEKLARILAGKNELTRAQRIKGFAAEGPIEATGRLVTIDGKVYFKTADQSYIPADKRFPYPELFFELHLSEDYAYRPLLKAGLVKDRAAVFDGPIRIRGNWAYERPYHIFGLVWVDAVEKASD